EWVHVQLHQQKGMISLSPPTICNSALVKTTGTMQMLGRAAGAQTQPEEGQQFSGQPQPEPQAEAGTKKGGAKTKGRGRKAAQPEPQPQPPEGDDYGFSDDIPF
ncbi:hypothetical protein RNP35_26180, partial [Escherichia coli]|nr:hypothetical protein [Escherichia coli]MDW6126273.1 hypothetical protein [Escherichia coli]MDW6162042.1 hypothetical protein [Escherichia coli]MDW6200028.1 hypothetical protein [Escherichia coli]MDW6256569.1 hypothetical protein [Escherichia coli]